MMGLNAPFNGNKEDLIWRGNRREYARGPAISSDIMESQRRIHLGFWTIILLYAGFAIRRKIRVG